MEPFDEDEYRAELLDARLHLDPFAAHVSVRGDGAAQFLFAESRNGSVELSKTQHLEIFLELWPPDSEEPTREETHPTYESALVSAVSWLRAV